MKKLIKFTLGSITILALPLSFLHGQDDDQSGGGSETAAEASVSGSASKKAIGAPESAESSPAINVAKAGLSVSQILTVSTDQLKSITQSGSVSELKSLVSVINSGDADLAIVADIAVSAKASGGKVKLTEIKERAEVVQIYVKSGVTGDDLANILNNLKNPNYTFNKESEKSKAKVVASGSASSAYLFSQLEKRTNLSDADIQRTVSAYNKTLPTTDAALKKFTDNLITSIKSLLNLTGTRGTINSTSDETSYIELSDIIKFTDPDILASFTLADDSDARFGLFMLYDELLINQSSNYSKEAVVDEITTLAEIANAIFTDKTLSGSNNLSDITKYTIDYITSKKPPQRLISYLAQYNILGFNNPGGGETALVSELPSDLLSQDFTNQDVTAFAEYLASYSTTRDTDGNLITTGRDLGDNDLSDYKVPLSNISLFPAKNINLSGSLDVSSELSEASLSNNKVEPEDIKIAVLGAANDITISGDLTITNDNKVEDHAMVLAAADDLVVKQDSKIEYTGSNLALASGDTMWLVDVDIKAGGNIAIGTLNNLNITRGSITAGVGGNTPNADLVLLYANDLIEMNSVALNDGIREIHLDAQRVAMRNITLPSESILRINVPGSKKWKNEYITVEGTSLQFSGSAGSKGSVVLENVTHPQIGKLNENNLPLVSSGS